MKNRNKKACVVNKSSNPAWRFVLTLDTDRVNPNDVEILEFSGQKFDNYYFAQKVATTVNDWIDQIYPEGYVGTMTGCVRTCTVSGELNFIHRDRGEFEEWTCFSFTGGHSSCALLWVKEATLPVKDPAIVAEYLKRVQKYYNSLPGCNYRLKATTLNALVRLK